jgi:hypothetical protein
MKSISKFNKRDAMELKMDIGELVKKLREKRKSFNKIADGIESDQINSFEGFERRIKKENKEILTTFTDDSLKLLFLNAKELKKTIRFSGQSYFSHVASSAYLLNHLNNEYKWMDEETEEKAKNVLSTHETLDCGLFYDDSKWTNLKKTAEWQQYRDELNDSILMVPPLSFGENLKQRNYTDLLENRFKKISVVSQVKEFGDSAIAYALIVDKINNLLDNEFWMNPVKKMSDYMGYVFFLVDELQEKISKEATMHIAGLLDEIRLKYNLSEATIMNKKEMYAEFKERYGTQLMTNSTEHLKKYEFQPLLK